MTKGSAYPDFVTNLQRTISPRSQLNALIHIPVPKNYFQKSTTMASTVPLLTLEEHFSAPDILDIPQLVQWGEVITEKLTSLSTGPRIPDMDADGVARQVISHTPFPSAQPPDICRAINDKLHAAVRDRPERFSGFACLPMTYPEEAAAELRRAVQELGFVGALVDNHTQGIFYDDARFDAVWEAAQGLDVPVYLHPSFASEAMMEIEYRGNYSDTVAGNLSEHVFGWHTETGLHFLRLFAAGMFDRFPRVKIVVGHMGETIPFMLDRQALVTRAWGYLERDLMTVWRENIYVTSSGMFDTPPLRCLLAYTPLEHVMFSVDYPFSSNEQGREFVEKVESQGVLTGEDLKKFVSGNAESLLRIKP